MGAGEGGAWKAGSEVRSVTVCHVPLTRGLARAWEGTPPATSLCFQREIDASRVDVPAGSAEPLRTQPAHSPLWSPGHPFFLPRLCGTPTFSHHVKPFCPDVPKSA